MTTHRTAALFAAVLASLFPLTAVALDWPLTEPRIQRDFAGELDAGYFPGMVLGVMGENHEAKAMQAGEIVHLHDETGGRRRIPWASGSSVLVDHGNGMTVLYGGLALEDIKALAGSITSKEGSKVGRGQKLGRAAGTVFSEGPGLFVMVLDMLRETIVNPQAMCPILPDNRRPVIHALDVRWAPDQEAETLGGKVEARSANPSFLMYVRDVLQAPGSDEAAVGLPHIVSVLLNGEALWRMEKTAIKAIGGRQYLYQVNGQPLDPSRTYMAGGRMDIGQFNLKEGVNRLDVVVVDYAGNRSGSQYRLTWNPPVQSPVEQ